MPKRVEMCFYNLTFNPTVIDMSDFEYFRTFPPGGCDRSDSR